MQTKLRTCEAEGTMQYSGAQPLRRACTMLRNAAIKLKVHMVQALAAGTGNLDTQINVLQTARASTANAASVASDIPYTVQASSSRRRALQQQRALPSQKQVSMALPHRDLRAASASTPYFDVTGDGAFNADDYIALVRLGLAWTNEYADGAAPWLSAFEQLVGGGGISDWQLQSTDPDFMCAPFICQSFGHMHSGVCCFIASCEVWGPEGCKQPQCVCAHCKREPSCKSAPTTASTEWCRYFSGDPAPDLPTLARPDGTTRPDFEARLLDGSNIDVQYYQQYIRPGTNRAFKQMQVWAGCV